MQSPLYMVKIGGSIITDTKKPSTARSDQIERLIAEIARAKKKKNFSLILGHGGGSFGHIAAKQYRINEGLVTEESRRGAIIVHSAMQQLNSIVLKAASEAGLDPYPFSPSSFAHSNDGKIDGGSVDAIRYALERGFSPVVHGDLTFDSAKGVSIASTEEVFRFITTSIKPNKVVLGADMDGVYDSDPNSNPSAKLVSLIDSSNISSMIEGAGGAKKVDVTGGMKTKLSILYEIIKNTGATGYIANAGKEGVIERILLGEGANCTTVRA
ncbi:MAG: isopentenyl phosphate kinase family protein [Candidatus Micrarchaeota archaeon]|nr:isopentenyl phosphate kinase family protein [Candidatus Micrarchaeota archaeon]